MRYLPNRIVTGTVIASMSVMLLGAVAYATGARINTTRSIPVGLYRLTSDPVEKGAYVMFCPPKADAFDYARMRGIISVGFCPGGYGYMMKRVLAAKNDIITIAEEGVSVNGKLLPRSTPIKTDITGHPLPRFRANRFTLDGSELLLMSDYRTSFDGRYFGPINRSQIKGVIRPVFTW